MITLADWFHGKASTGISGGNVTSQFLIMKTDVEGADTGTEFIQSLIENIFTSSQLTQLADGTRIFSARLSQWQSEVQKSLEEFDEAYSCQTRNLLMAVVMPWLREKITSKAIDDICCEFGELAKNQKLDAMLLSAPPELRPSLEKRLGLATESLPEESAEVAIQFGASRIQTNIESWFEKLKELLLA